MLGACQVQANDHIITPEAASIVRHVGPSFVSGQTREGITRTGRRCRLPLSHTLILDNGPQYTATATVLYAHELDLVPITTPAYSPQSNGLAEAFVETFKRDYVEGAVLRDAESVLAQLSGWMEDYNTRAPHSALGMRSPADYRAAVTLGSSR